MKTFDLTDEKLFIIAFCPFHPHGRRGRRRPGIPDFFRRAARHRARGRRPRAVPSVESSAPFRAKHTLNLRDFKQRRRKRRVVARPRPPRCRFLLIVGALGCLPARSPSLSPATHRFVSKLETGGLGPNVGRAAALSNDRLKSF